MDEALALAVCAPSNSNVQPWHNVFASGAARDRLVAALLDEARSKPPKIPPLPEAFAHIRRELGAQVYGSMGIAREDSEGRRVAVLRNWEFSARRWLALSAFIEILAQSIASASGCFCKRCSWR